MVASGSAHGRGVCSARPPNEPSCRALQASNSSPRSSHLLPSIGFYGNLPQIGRKNLSKDLTTKQIKQSDISSPAGLSKFRSILLGLFSKERHASGSFISSDKCIADDGLRRLSYKLSRKRGHTSIENGTCLEHLYGLSFEEYDFGDCLEPKLSKPLICRSDLERIVINTCRSGVLSKLVRVPGDQLQISSEMKKRVVSTLQHSNATLSRRSKLECSKEEIAGQVQCSDTGSNNNQKNGNPAEVHKLGVHEEMHQEGQKYGLPKDKSIGFGNRNNAIAGALAGIFVSLCLHPIDTVKTVLQSQNSNCSVFTTVTSIIKQRGLWGLYRGLGSNLVSSAPISAIYTFSYESIKAALLPHVPKEYHPLAHCIAGGCASIATSFVYTPSECVKQQMQVGAQYSNSFYALVGILKERGILAMYAGWGAVLLRNVPQSIIKFSTYESLKGWLLSREPCNGRLTELQTLAVGGIAGSTAALFTTPFDVIKTRIQTQSLGTSYQYKGVFDAMQRIISEEGLKNLYRGLGPRLVIYVSQGALFFASYEFFKRALVADVPHLRKGKIIDDASEGVSI